MKGQYINLSNTASQLKRGSMVKVQMLDSGEVKTVTPNEAFGLVDAGLAKVYRPTPNATGYKAKPYAPELKQKRGYKVK